MVPAVKSISPRSSRARMENSSSSTTRGFWQGPCRPRIGYDCLPEWSRSRSGRVVREGSPRRTVAGCSSSLMIRRRSPCSLDAASGSATTRPRPPAQPRRAHCDHAGRADRGGRRFAPAARGGVRCPGPSGARRPFHVVSGAFSLRDGNRLDRAAPWRIPRPNGGDRDGPGPGCSPQHADGGDGDRGAAATDRRHPDRHSTARWTTGRAGCRSFCRDR